LYPIGEVNGSHGVSRPGGSALNAGQVGALRAATRIIGYGKQKPLNISDCETQLKGIILQVENYNKNSDNDLSKAKKIIDEQLKELQYRMSRFAGPIRDYKFVCMALTQAKKQQEIIFNMQGIPNVYLPKVLKLRHMVLAQVWYLFAIKTYLEKGGGSRGSYLVVSKKGKVPHTLLNNYRMIAENKSLCSFVHIVGTNELNELESKWIPCRAVPSESFWFEKVWREFKEKTYLDF
jgi:hypothetical protein